MNFFRTSRLLSMWHWTFSLLLEIHFLEISNKILNGEKLKIFKTFRKYKKKQEFFHIKKKLKLTSLTHILRRSFLVQTFKKVIVTINLKNGEKRKIVFFGFIWNKEKIQRCFSFSTIVPKIIFVKNIFLKNI